MIRMSLDQATFDLAIRKMADISGRTLREECIRQAGLFTRDAMLFTPPFGNQPIEEGGNKQKLAGHGSVKSDIKTAFSALADLKIIRDSREFGLELKRLLRKGDFTTAEVLLRREGIRTTGVIQRADKAHHEKKRDRYGKVQSVNPWRVVQKPSIGALLKEKLKWVGFAKSGWLYALHKTGRTVPGFGWIAKKAAGLGVYREGGSTEKPRVEIGNAVPYIQKYHDKIIGRAHRNRLRNTPKEAAAMEKAIARKLKREGVTA